MELENKNEIEIDGMTYVKKSAYKEAKNSKGLKYIIARTQSAGVFAGYLVKRTGKEAELCDARRIWYWTGAASLSQLAMEGTNSPSTCKFPVAVKQVMLTEVIEILSVTEEARKSIESVPVWKQ